MYVYEVPILKHVSIQIGYCNSNFNENESSVDEGIANDESKNSYGFNPKLSLIYHAGKSKKYGDTVKPGDRISCLIDLHKKCIHYFLNGVHMGIAFEDVNITDKVFPLVSISENAPLNAIIETPDMEYLYKIKDLDGFDDVLPFDIVNVEIKEDVKDDSDNDELVRYITDVMDNGNDNSDITTYIVKDNTESKLDDGVIALDPRASMYDISDIICQALCVTDKDKVWSCISQFMNYGYGRIYHVTLMNNELYNHFWDNIIQDAPNVLKNELNDIIHVIKSKYSDTYMPIFQV